METKRNTKRYVLVTEVWNPNPTHQVVYAIEYLSLSRNCTAKLKHFFYFHRTPEVNFGDILEYDELTDKASVVYNPRLKFRLQADDFPDEVFAWIELREEAMRQL